jgi:hypothetical protein
LQAEGVSESDIHCKLLGVFSLKDVSNMISHFNPDSGHQRHQIYTSSGHVEIWYQKKIWGPKRIAKSGVQYLAFLGKEDYRE